MLNNYVIISILVKCQRTYFMYIYLVQHTFLGFPLLPISKFQNTVDGTQADLLQTLLTEIFVLSEIIIKIKTSFIFLNF